MPLRRLRRSSVAALLTALSLPLAGCGSADEAAGAAGSGADAGSVTVVASTNVYGAVAQAIGGDRIEVTSLITDPVADPHAYEATPADAADVAGATVFVFNGGGYDEFAPQLAESAGGDGTVIDVVTLSGLETATAPGAEFNEHVWYNLPTMEKLADRLAADLAAAAPADAATFTANAAAFNTQIDGLIAKLDAIKAGHGGARIAITEPIPVYITDAAGLQNVTPDEFAEAIEEDTDPPAAVLQETLALFETDPVQALVLNLQTQTPTTEQVRQVATAAGVPVVEVSETLPDGDTEYISWMSGQIDVLAGALNPI